MKRLSRASSGSLIKSAVPIEAAKVVKKTDSSTYTSSQVVKFVTDPLV